MALLNQTAVINEIIVIDNNYFFETYHFLCEKKILLPEQKLRDGQHPYYSNNCIKWGQKEIIISYYKMGKNIGSGGGFYKGMKLAYQKEYKWIWLMDDDGYPSQNCLEKLLKYKSESYCICPVVLDIEQPDDLSFGLTIGKEIFKDYDEVKKYYYNNKLEGTANFFNGVLLNREIITALGYPIKDFFIWGDEREYFIRIRESHFNILSIYDAKFYHPANEMVLKNFLNIFKVICASDLKLFCIIRNHAVIERKYHGHNKFLLWCCKEIVKRVVIFRIKDLPVVLRAIYHAMINKWGGEEKYFNIS